MTNEHWYECMDEPVIIDLIEKHGIRRIDNPVRLGVPCPKGWLVSTKHLQLASEEDLKAGIPLQTRTLAFWPDGSIKWVLLDFFVSIAAKGNKKFYLTKNTTSANHLNGVVVSKSDKYIKVDTGEAQFVINPDRDIFFSKCKLTNKNIFFNGWHLKFVDSRKKDCQVEEITWDVEDAGGSVLAILKSKGKIWDSKRKKFLNITVRQFFYAGKRTVKMDLVLHNPNAVKHVGGMWDLGDKASFFFDELSVYSTADNSIEKLSIYLEINGEEIHFAPNCLVYQDSSGGEQWNSKNHVDCKGNITTEFQGYRFGNRIGNLDNLAASGRRATPRIKAIMPDGWQEIYVNGFWQNFPKSISVDQDIIAIGLFPKESTQLYELQGGEQKRHSFICEMGRLADSSSGICCGELMCVIDPRWIESTKTLPYFSIQEDDKNEEYLRYISNCIQGKHSFFNRRELIDEYGWRNFGDLYADHEAVNHHGDDLFISHYNNQYDFIYGSLFHFLRSGEHEWFQLATELSRHVIDIDIYRTKGDKSAYNNGLFWHTDHYRNAETSTHRTYSRLMYGKEKKGFGGGPSNEHNYTTGLLYYYYLTGDILAAETVTLLADWVLEMDDGRKTILAVFDQGATGLASQTVETNFHNPGRGAGNSINALLDGFQLTNEYKYLQKVEELIQRCIHPNDDIDSLELMQPEYRWSYLVFLQVLAKYLFFKIEMNDFGYCYCYGRDSLLHYVNWMYENETPYLDVIDRVEIPTETWPAQDIRKSHIFHVASLFVNGDRKLDYIKKADYFFNRSLNDVKSFDTAFLTRPLVIFTVYGAIHSFFQKNGHYFLPMSCKKNRYSFGYRSEFIPQKVRFKRVFGESVKNFFSGMIRLCR